MRKKKERKKKKCNLLTLYWLLETPISSNELNNALSLFCGMNFFIEVFKRLKYPSGKSSTSWKGVLIVPASISTITTYKRIFRKEEKGKGEREREKPHPLKKPIYL